MQTTGQWSPWQNRVRWYSPFVVPVADSWQQLLSVDIGRHIRVLVTKEEDVDDPCLSSRRRRQRESWLPRWDCGQIDVLPREPLETLVVNP